ncbi:uncharacterized protein LOC134262018 [Saccostrea cucullata]|uniref:uncharacterized protein LOC134262018 n=1 Tax=Saccostrea cuccullata TaxID=36930 RepID=UPI002ED11D1C
MLLIFLFILQCVWILVATVCLVICLTEASGDKKCDVIKFGKGKYDKKKECWKKEPTTPNLEATSVPQSLKIRRKIQRALKCRMGIKKFLAQKSCDCDPSKWSSIGLKNVCPIKFEYTTEIKRGGGKKCYVVFPSRQCVTFAKCDRKKNCSKRNQTNKLKSACLADRFRYFSVWIFCPDKHRFEYETVLLPQCCSCREYKLC